MEGLTELMEMFPARPVEELRAALGASNNIDEAVDRLVSADVFAMNFQDQPAHPAHGTAEDVNMKDVPIIEISSSPSASPSPRRRSYQGNASMHAIPKVISEDECLANVVAIFPDVNTDHVRRLYKEQKLANVEDIVGTIVEKLLAAGSDYPRQEKASKKRKRSLSSEANQSHPYLANDRKDVDGGYIAQAMHVLKVEFPRVPDSFIRTALTKNRSFLAPTYLAIAKAEAGYDEKKPRNEFKRLRSVRYMDRKKPAPQLSKEIMAELEFAKSKVHELKRQKQEEDDARLAASLDHKEQEDNGQLMECQCCFGDEKFSKMTQCREGHLFCLNCAKNYAESQVGQGKYQLNCMDGSGCKAEFPRTEIMRFVNEKVMLALDKLQQDAELRLAAMDDLEKCPFCEFAAILGPVEEDKEFRCENPECLEVSCRLCKEKTHVPKSCEEFKKEHATLNARHAVEEAMTAAMIRSCNKCQNKFIKDWGCNKMTCTRCGTMQCYVCSETIKDYKHFQGQGGTCPLYDNHEERHEEERRRAAEAAVAQLAQKDPTITAKDVEIKLSDEAQRAEAARVQRIGQIHRGAGAAFNFGAQPIYFPGNHRGGLPAPNLGLNGQVAYNPAAMAPAANGLANNLGLVAPINPDPLGLLNNHQAQHMRIMQQQQQQMQQHMANIRGQVQQDLLRAQQDLERQMQDLHRRFHQPYQPQQPQQPQPRQQQQPRQPQQPQQPQQPRQHAAYNPAANNNPQPNRRILPVRGQNVVGRNPIAEIPPVPRIPQVQLGQPFAGNFNFNLNGNINQPRNA